MTGWGLYAARAFAKREVITVYVGEDIGQAGSAEAAANMNELIAQDKGRHVMQVNRRIKGRKDNVRLIDGEHGFTGAQNANTAKGTMRKDNVEFGDTGTFIAKERIECNDELLIKYDGNRTGGKYWDVWGKANKGRAGGDDEGTPSPSPPPHPHPQVQHGAERGAGPSCSRRRERDREGGPIRRNRVNAINKSPS